MFFTLKEVFGLIVAFICNGYFEMKILRYMDSPEDVSNDAHFAHINTYGFLVKYFLKTNCNMCCKNRRFSKTFEENLKLVKQEQETAVNALCVSELIKSYKKLNPIKYGTALQLVANSIDVVESDKDVQILDAEEQKVDHQRK